MNLKNQILACYLDIELTDISSNIRRLVIEGRNDLIWDLKITDHNQIESIIIVENSLQNIRSLTIKNNSSLKMIFLNNEACYFVALVTISGSLHSSL